MSEAYKQGTAKVAMAIGNADLGRCIRKATEQVGFQWKSGIAPRNHQERVLQLITDRLRGSHNKGRPVVGVLGGMGPEAEKTGFELHLS